MYYANQLKDDNITHFTGKIVQIFFSFHHLLQHYFLIHYPGVFSIGWIEEWDI